MLTAIPARNWTIEVENSAGDSFIEIDGLQTMTWSHSDEQLDTTNMNSNGKAENMIIERSQAVSLEGDWMEDPDDGSRDPGQERVETLGNEVGLSSIGTMKLTSPGGTIYEFDATVSLGEALGGRNEKSSWAATFNISGSVNKT